MPWTLSIFRNRFTVVALRSGYYHPLMWKYSLHFQHNALQLISEFCPCTSHLSLLLLERREDDFSYHWLCHPTPWYLLPHNGHVLQNVLHKTSFLPFLRTVTCQPLLSITNLLPSVDETGRHCRWVNSTCPGAHLDGIPCVQRSVQRFLLAFWHLYRLCTAGCRLFEKKQLAEPQMKRSYWDDEHFESGCEGTALSSNDYFLQWLLLVAALELSQYCCLLVLSRLVSWWRCGTRPLFWLLFVSWSLF